MSYILIINLDAECFNDPKVEVELNYDGDLIIFETEQEAINYAEEQNLENYEVYKKIYKK
jgi:hypothetical protein